MQVEQLSYALGAEITGVSVAEAAVNDDLFGEINELFLKHKVLFFRDQDITDAEHAAFARRFGPLDVHPLAKSLDDEPGIIKIYQSPTKPVERYNNSWHVDAPFQECPPLGAVLRCVECPPFGGDTMWANMELVYEQLPDHVKETIDGLYANHSLQSVFMAPAPIEKRLETKARVPDVEHPVVRTHPVTGRKSLFTGAFITHFTNFHTPANVQVGADWLPGATNLLNYLVSRASVPEYQVRFRWRPNSIALWDNRCTQHYAVSDYPPCVRKMHRATIAGDRPV